MSGYAGIGLVKEPNDFKNNRLVKMGKESIK